MTTPTRLLLGACGALCSVPALAQNESMPDLSEVTESLVEIRGLEFKEEVPAERQSIEDFKAFVTAEIEQYFPEDKQEGMQQGLLRLGLLDEPLDMGEAFANALLSQAAAYYDPGSGKFYYLMTDMPLTMLRTIASHELVHALQDQHFELGTKMEALEAEAVGNGGPRNEDRVLAFRYLVEGEATYVMTIWQMKSMMGTDLMADKNMEAMMIKMMADMDIDQLIAMSKKQMPMLGGEDGAMAEAIKAMEDIPSYILAPLYAAYMQGAYFTMKLRHADGWDGVAKAYESLPQSAEQTIHPEKFLDERDDPTPMSLAPLAAAMVAGLEEIDSAILGEFYLGLLLSNLDVGSSDAKAAAAGWDGDLYRAYRNREGQVIIVVATTWDTEDEAAEFAETYRTGLNKKYPKLVASHDDGTAFHFACGDAGLGVGRLVQRGREVFIVEGAGTNLSDRLLDELKAQPVDHVE